MAQVLDGAARRPYQGKGCARHDKKMTAEENVRKSHALAR